MRCFGGCLIWIAFLASVLIAAGGGWYAYNLSSSDEYKDTDTADYLTYSAYTLWGVAILFVLILMCCYSRLQLGIAVFKTTVDFTASNCCIFFLPLVGLVIHLVWFIVWVISFVYVFSVGEVTQRNSSLLSFTTEIMWETNTRYLLILQVFGLLWVSNFLNGCQQFVIACAACIWYFTVRSDTGGSGNICKSIWWLAVYHQGSIAFGSCVIAICQMIRLIFEWYARQVRKANPDNKCIKCCLCITGYCLWCVEKCVKYISKNAYI